VPPGLVARLDGFSNIVIAIGREGRAPGQTPDVSERIGAA